MNLQEHIRKVLREDEYSPAGKEIIPNKIVIHKSNPKVRDRISNDGLKARAGECYKIYAGYGEKCIPAIFATNSTNKRAWFDSTYDDDIWAINTEMIPDVKWYKDRHFDSTKKHIVTFDNIPQVFEGWHKIWVTDVVAQDFYKYPYASKWIAMNMLVVDPHTVICDKNQIELIKTLKSYRFEVIPLELRHSRTLGGGFHCVTLDLHRES